jgi:peptidoglycan/xylan/chitin deacetylase (PgdA/CDA1 family)
MLDVHEIREMAGTGLIEFGAHTCSHAILSGLAPDERTREIAGSLTAVERFTQSRCDMFAYPNGRVCDYGASDVAALRKRQVAVAVTTVEGPNDRSIAPLELRRYGIGAGLSFAQFKLRAHHLVWKLQGSMQPGDGRP